MKTETFAAFYRDVTRKLSQHLKDTESVTPSASYWLRDVQKAFQKEFENWPNLERHHPIHQSLALLDDEDTDWLFRLAGHAYIHIAYDLPRVMSKSMPEGRNDVRLGYLHLGPLFVDLFVKWAAGHKLGNLSWALAALPDGSELLRGAARPILALRATAWIQAEVLSDCANGGPGGGTGLAMEEHLARHVWATFQAQKEKHWPVQLAALDNSRAIGDGQSQVTDHMTNTVRALADLAARLLDDPSFDAVRGDAKLQPSSTSTDSATSSLADTERRSTLEQRREGLLTSEAFKEIEGPPFLTNKA